MRFSRRRLKRLGLYGCFLLGGPFTFHCKGQNDTLRVMTYNVLYYGDTPPCQAPHNVLHKYLKTIVNYTRPDILGLVKVASTAVTEDDIFSSAPKSFSDSILHFALNEDVYSHCPYTNEAHGNNVELLFYNHKKLGFAGVVATYANITDFSTYKLYYRTPDLGETKDTLFLYVTLNHTKSGDEYETVRGEQVKYEMEGIREHFNSLPNMINMGDFNLRGSNETCYQELVAPKDSAFRFFDPPFYPDGDLKYPADWDNDRVGYAKYLTTSTRQDEGVPNDCGTAGGAKNWYDHIFLSSQIVNGSNGIRYIPHSYQTIGNDGYRYKVSVNNSNSPNTSAPQEVIDALYRMSNKYPVMISLEVLPNENRHANNAEKIAAVHKKEMVTIDRKINDEFTLHFTAGMDGEDMTMECLDNSGNTVMKKAFKVNGNTKKVACKLPAGEYTARFCTKHNLISKERFTKE